MPTTTAGSTAPGRGWVLVLALAVGQLVSWGTTFYTFPLVIDPMTAELGWQRTTAYMAPALGLVMQAILRSAGGFLDAKAWRARLHDHRFVRGRGLHPGVVRRQRAMAASGRLGRHGHGAGFRPL